MIKNQKRFFIIVVSLLVLTGFLVTSLISYFVAKDSISDRLQQEMLPLTSDNIYSEIQRDLLRPLLISSVMANDTFVMDWVRDGEKNPAKMEQYLAKIQQKYQTITAFFVSEKTRRYYHPTGVLKTLSADNPADAWYFNLKKRSDNYDINIDHDTAAPNRLSIFVNYKVYDREGNYIGAIGVGLSMKAVAKLIEEYQQRYGRQIYFVDREGKVMLHSSDYSSTIHLQNKAGLKKLFTRILTTPSASVSYAGKNGNTIYLNSRLVPQFNWFLIVEQVNDPASKRIETALIVNILVSIAISIVVLLIAHLTLRGYQRRLENMATKDKLTGAASRQVFDVLFARAVKVAKRKQYPLSLILVDIDYFKNLNDNYGHHYGDQVLMTFSRIISSQVRDEDTLCRWGGEEFLLLLENCNLQRATEIAESIREAVAAYRFQHGKHSIRITLSAGVAQQHNDEPMAQLIERCDQALYEAKEGGRNQIRQSL